jgi:PhzF family phenazine biosynthesis protein
MPEMEIWHVNVFSSNPFGGNPAAVGFCDNALDGAIMQSIARTMNLSESVFISPPLDPRANYRARIFGVQREFPFAVHPTIAAAFAFSKKHQLEKSDKPIRLRQDCGAGIVEIESQIRPAGLSLFVTQRSPSFLKSDANRETVARAIGCADGDVCDGPFTVVSTGVPWLLVQLRTLDAVRTLRPDFTRIAQLGIAAKAVGVTVFTRETSSPASGAHLRSFAPAGGLYEDPVCGSCHGALAAYLNKNCPKTASAFARGETLVLEQGEEINLPGTSEVIARKATGTTEFLVGGLSVVTLRGTISW